MDKQERWYTIQWNIELLASSPEEAAKQAFDSICNGTARVFEVMDTVKDELKIVDLDDENNLTNGENKD